MTKSICAMPRRPDLSRAAFQSYYEGNHAPLAIQHFPFTRYVRNHLLDGNDLPFDTISEFWAEDIAATAALMHGPIGVVLRADEEKFVNRPAIAPAGSDEHVLSKGVPGVERSVTLVAADGITHIRPALFQWSREVAAAMPAVSLDLPASWGSNPFPAAAVLWSPEPPGAVPAALAGRIRHLRVRRCETPPEDLLGNRP